MKFGHVLKDFADGTEAAAVAGEGSAPRDFVSYKRLKKLLKKAAESRRLEQEAELDGRAGQFSGEPPRPGAAQPTAPLPEEREFVTVLVQDLHNINAFFMEREEEAVIRLQALEDRLKTEGSSSEALRGEFINFHGEMVLLLHWSLMNYAGVAKILKKHDKLLGEHGQVLHPFLASVLHQPFTSTDGISQLVKQAEGHVQRLRSGAAIGGSSAAAGADATGEACGSAEEAALLKRTRAALGMLHQLQETAHTPSTLLPIPGDGDARASKVPKNE